ncbi:microtubule-associated proteins 1A/1B light chain 3C isoform X2 [Phacochoerus africanus]|uniref:microtubule-associated proteins 1A/1B light chain 3C isoform X2 n=1 Tax=Phacochoerus africanus TaxID=41426 RepID=UPI001FD8F31F|nr:microtubule-associated proteins 1A/1B light chain 3C isoform X2 [Phacochoerus africanus]
MQTPQKSPSLRPFKQRKSLATRREEVAGIRVKFPGKIPVIVERYPREKFLPLLDKTKFLVPQELTMTQFLSIIRSPSTFHALPVLHPSHLDLSMKALKPTDLKHPLGIRHCGFPHREQ